MTIFLMAMAGIIIFLGGLLTGRFYSHKNFEDLSKAYRELNEGWYDLCKENNDNWAKRCEKLIIERRRLEKENKEILDKLDKERSLRRQNRMPEYIIAVDFDGTLCENAWPWIGEPINTIIDYVKEMQGAGAKLILWTCRSGELLDMAVEWCKEHGVIFDAVNQNVPEIIEAFGEDGRKVFANEYIDDRNRTVFKLPFAKGE